MRATPRPEHPEVPPIGDSASRRRPFDSVTSRILLALLGCLAPVYAVAITFFSQARSLIAEEITSAMQSEADFFITVIDAELARLERQMQELVYDDDVLRLAYTRPTLTDYEYTAAMNRVQARLSVLQKSTDFVDDAAVLFFTIGRGVSAGVTRSPSLFAIEEDYGDRVDAGRVASGRFLLDQNTLAICVPSPGSDPAYTVRCTLSNRAVRSTLSGLSGGMGTMVVLSAIGFPYEVSWPQEIAGYPLVGDADYLSISARSNQGPFEVRKYVPIVAALGEVHVYQIWLIVFSAVVVLIMIPFAAYVRSRIQAPLRTLMAGFAAVESGALSTRVDRHTRDEFDIVFRSFNTMSAGLEQAIQQLAEERSAAKEAELRQLQSNINPHFLYNTYFILHRLIRDREWEAAVDFSRLMGEYLRYINRSTTAHVPLSEEIKHVRAYVEIQKARFEDRIAVDFGPIPASVEGAFVPPLILQPVVENVFVHGLSETEEAGMLRIAFRSPDRSRFTVVVEDNGDQLTDDALAELREVISRPQDDGYSSALANVRRRLSLRYGDDDLLTLDRSPLGGLRVSLCFPTDQPGVVDS